MEITQVKHLIIVTPVVPDALSLAKVPKLHLIVRASSQAQKVAIMLTKHNTLNSVSMAADFKPNFVFIARPDIVKYHAVIRVADDDDVPAFAGSDTRWTGGAPLARRDYLVYHPCGIFVNWDVTSATFQPFESAHMGLKFLHNFFLHEVIDLEVAVIRYRK